MQIQKVNLACGSKTKRIREVEIEETEIGIESTVSGEKWGSPDQPTLLFFGYHCTYVSAHLAVLEILYIHGQIGDPIQMATIRYQCSTMESIYS